MHDIYILGSGAMGSLWASYLYPQHTLHFIQRKPDNSEYLFTVEPHNKDVKGHSLSAQEIKADIEYLILATKAYDAIHAINSVKDKLSNNACVILLQNGLGSQQAISAEFPTIKLFACSSTEGAYKSNSNTLIHAGKGVNTIGPMNAQATQSDLSAWLPKGHYEWRDDMDYVLWRKFMINCAINPLTVLYNCQNGELLKQKDYFTHMQKLCEEIDLITHVLFPNTLENAFTMAQKTCELTAQNFSSMLQDRRKGNSTEIDYMTGYLLEQAKTLNIPCPYNEALYNQLNQA
ncbi:MAG: 2-dehydropantoate 2-reductase [Bermanella sp.]